MVLVRFFNFYDSIQNFIFNNYLLGWRTSYFFFRFFFELLLFFPTDFFLVFFPETLSVFFLQLYLQGERKTVSPLFVGNRQKGGWPFLGNPVCFFSASVPVHTKISSHMPFYRIGSSHQSKLIHIYEKSWFGDFFFFSNRTTTAWYNISFVKWVSTPIKRYNTQSFWNLFFLWIV